MKSPVSMDMVCVGFGPAAIALAAAIEDEIEAGAAIDPGKICFLERNRAASWHESMMLPGTIINHNHLRDLVTPRNPRSRFSFSCYLHEKGRIFEFGHLGGVTSRAEWADYIRWVSGQLEHLVRYDRLVTSIAYLKEGKGKGLIEIKANGDVYHTRKLVLAMGGRTNIPDLFKPHLSDRVFHTRNLLSKLKGISTEDVKSFLVIGSGQSAIETIIHLHGRYPKAQIHSLHRMVGFRIKESGHTSNVIYFPDETNYFHSLPASQRKAILEMTTSADYGNVNNATSAELFKILYEDKVIGQERVFLHNRKEVAAVTHAGGTYTIGIVDPFLGDCMQLDVDAVVLGTGYFEEAVPYLLTPLGEHLVFESDGERSLVVNRDYRVETVPGFEPSIFLCGMSERTHGISDTQSFSLMATKAGTILEGLALEA